MALNKDAEYRINWNKENIVILCDVCIKYITENGRGKVFKWQVIEDMFAERVGKRFSSKSLKNKYDAMKKDWRLWRFLKIEDPGFGWNRVTGMLDCSDEWWERKLKEKPDAKKYRYKGVCPLIEEKWDHLFGDDVVKGVRCVAPVSCVAPSSNSNSDNSDFVLMWEHLQKVHEINTEIVDLIKQGINTEKNEAGTSIDQIMDIMNRITANDDVKVGGDIWCHAMLMFRDPINRDIFFKMPSDDARLSWLKFAQTRNII